jgi:hypothetical protein
MLSFWNHGLVNSMSKCNKGGERGKSFPSVLPKGKNAKTLGRRIAKMLQAKSYFVHPFSSREREFNEYMNSLIRPYFPKKLPFCNESEQDVNNIQHKINRRPGKNPNFDTPKKQFFECIRNFVVFDGRICDDAANEKCIHSHSRDNNREMLAGYERCY